MTTPPKDHVDALMAMPDPEKLRTAAHYLDFPFMAPSIKEQHEAAAFLRQCADYLEASARALAAVPAAQAEREEYIADVNRLRGEEIGHRMGLADARRAQQAGGVPAGFVAATDPEDCNAWCPRCNGHGHDVEMSDSSPDAHEVMVNCRHCGGEGTLYAAYTGVVRELAKKHQAYIKACGELYFDMLAAAPSPSAVQPLSEAQIARIEADEALMRTMLDALEDITNGWKYIRNMHGDLYGVGWDRAQDKADAAITALRSRLETK